MGGGFALQLVSPTVLDFVMVIVSGIEPDRTGGLPYRVRLVNSRGELLRVGLIEELDARARLNTGSPSPFSMMQGIDQTIDGVMFVGYHARNGSQNAILDHTWSSRTVANVWLNDRLTGEYGLNAAVAGHFATPVIMVSGDQTACAQVTELIGDVETAVVKQASGRFAAECLAPQVTQEVICMSAERAVERLAQGNAPEPFVLDTPIIVTVEFFTSDMADRATRIPFTTREGRRVSLTAQEMASAYNGFRAMVMLASG